jgi:flavin-dependent dehydrogenase
MKITIIGASTPGLFAAYLLANAGADVEVYERSSALNSLPRTLIVTGKISDVLGFVPKEAILNEVRYVELLSKSRSAKVELSRPDLIVERERLVVLLAQMAERAGARIILKRRFMNLTSAGEGVIITLRNLETGKERQTRTDVLIGADGAFSSVARVSSHNGHLYTSLLQARVRLPEQINRHTCQVWFDPSRTKYFYWLIPESDETAVVGLIADDARQAGSSLKAFLREQRLEPLEYQAAMVPMHKFEYAARVMEVRNKVFLIGDAAAQVKVTTVGGVVTGLRGAKAVVDAILNGSNTGKEIGRLKRELDLHLLARRLLHGFTDADYDALIGFLDGGLKEVLSERTRDELSQMYLKLIASQPRLVILGAKALLRGIR